MPACRSLARSIAFCGAADVEQRVLRLVGRHVVDRGEVEEVVDLAAQRVARRRRRRRAAARTGRRRRRGCGRRRRAARPALRASRVEPVADEHVDVALALEQPLDQVAADEAGGARHEVVGTCFLLGVHRERSLSRAGSCGYQPPRMSARAARALAARLRASLRLSRRHWIMLITKTNSGKNAIRMKPAFVTTLSFVSPQRPSPPSCASAAGRAQREQARRRANERAYGAHRTVTVPWRSWPSSSPQISPRTWPGARCCGASRSSSSAATG